MPVEYLPLNVRCGLAPAMKANGNTTFWGRQLPATVSKKVAKLLGVNNELQTPGTDADVTQEREDAQSIIEDPGKPWPQCETAAPQV